MIKYFALIIISWVLVLSTANAQVYQMGNTSAYGWYKLGTVSLAQGGYDATFRLVGGHGYNAAIDQNSEAFIHFRTSNSAANYQGFYGAVTFYNTGIMRLVEGVRFVQLSQSSWEVYASLAQYAGYGCFLHFLSSSGTWTNSFQSVSSAPAGKDATEAYFGNSKFIQFKPMGINTQTPITPLTIFNNAGQGHLTLQSNDQAATSSRTDIDFQVADKNQLMSRISGYYENSQNGGYGGLKFYTNYAGAMSERLTINALGKIGIGSANPQETLSVNGTVLAKKVRVSQAAADWPDYVFDSAYQLPSLESVSTFIKEKNHLPEMPSASTIEKDGHDLGEVQKLLLKKMEEMTLYMIEQANAIKELRAENKVLRQEINQLQDK